MVTPPDIFVSDGFLDAARTANVVGMTPNPADIDTVLRHGGERYRENELATALGAVVLLHPEERASDSGLRVHQVLPHDIAAEPPQLVALTGTSRSAEEIAARYTNSLTATAKEPTEPAIAWGLYDAASAKGNPSVDTMNAGLKSATELTRHVSSMNLGGFDFLKDILGGLVGGAQNLAGSVPQLKRANDKPTIDASTPILLTRRGDAPQGS